MAQYDDYTKMENEKLWILTSAGDQDARNELSIRNKGLVGDIVKNYPNTNIEYEDLFQIGFIGLLKAIDKFNPNQVNKHDPKKKVKFASFASVAINNEILMVLRKKKRSNSEESYDAPIARDKDGDEQKLIDILGTEVDAICDEAMSGIKSKALKEAVSKLTRKEQYVILWRYGIINDEGETQAKIAESLGLSRPAISRIETKALTKLSHPRITRKIKDFHTE